MQYLFIALFAFSLLCAGPAQAGESRGNLSNIKKPIELNGGTSKRMFVTFNHSSHKGVKCRTCHHEGCRKTVTLPVPTRSAIPSRERASATP